ncbi:MAG: GTPase Era [Acidobacteria bacterium]|nr:GTPase Era [Acidobacteriota bacterium]MBS1865797.1 GTPase Era [Acidobacteriota bacterium]
MSESATKQQPNHRAGFVAIVGRPNAGKSTLLNKLVGQKIAIVTSKPQTTRNRIQGIVTRPEGQIVFIDTPGIHEAKSFLNKQMNREINAAVEGIDVLLLMADAIAMQPHADNLLIDRAKRFHGKVILALNKVDKLPKSKLLPILDAFQKQFPFAAMVPISALKGDGVEGLVEEILKLLPEADPYFPEDQVTDQPERFLASEIIREKAIALTYHEVPHALAVFVEKWEEKPKLLRIEATMHVERPSQKKILIGHKGEMLKKIGTQARKELETLLDTRIYLGLFVKVVPDWRENPQHVRELDWHAQIEALGEEQALRERARHEHEDFEEGGSAGADNEEADTEADESEEKED